MASLRGTLAVPFATYNTTVVRGETFRRTITVYNADGVTPVNLTGSTFAMQWRPQLGSATVSLNCTPFITVPTPTNGQVVIAVPAVSVAVGRYVYDLKWTDSGGVVRVPMAGTVEVITEVTA